MSRKRYSEEFKREAIRQITVRGHRVGDVSQRLGVTGKSLRTWMEQARVGGGDATGAGEILRLKAELRRVTEERDILKKAAAYFAKESR